MRFPRPTIEPREQMPTKRNPVTLRLRLPHPLVLKMDRLRWDRESRADMARYALEEMTDRLVAEMEERAAFGSSSLPHARLQEIGRAIDEMSEELVAGGYPVSAYHLAHASKHVPSEPAN